MYIQNNTMTNTYKCENCDYTSKNKQLVQQHMKYKHRPNKYDSCCIYQIIDLKSGNYYIGSTHLPIKERLRIHEYHYKSFLKGKMNFVSSYNVLKGGNYEIVAIHMLKCKNSEELKVIENEQLKVHLENINCVNINRSYNTEADRVAYRANNKERLSTKGKCECGGKYTYGQISTHNKTKRHQQYMIQILNDD